MRNLKNSALTFLVIALANLSASAAVLGEENFNKSVSSGKQPVGKSCRQFVHTSFINGKMIPAVNLPVVTISADRKSQKVLEVFKKDNSFIAVVDLPEVVISGVKKTSGYRLRTMAGKNGNIPVADLNQVVITAERINNSSVSWIEANEKSIPVVNLPEVVISSDFSECNLLSTIVYKGHLIPAVNLPVVEITAERNADMVAENENSTGDNNGMIEGYLPSVEAKAELSISSVVLILVKTAFLKL